MVRGAWLLPTFFLMARPTCLPQDQKDGGSLQVSWFKKGSAALLMIKRSFNIRLKLYFSRAGHLQMAPLLTSNTPWDTDLPLRGRTLSLENSKSLIIGSEQACSCLQREMWSLLQATLPFALEGDSITSKAGPCTNILGKLVYNRSCNCLFLQIMQRCDRPLEMLSPGPYSLLPLYAGFLCSRRVDQKASKNSPSLFRTGCSSLLGGTDGGEKEQPFAAMWRSWGHLPAAQDLLCAGLALSVSVQCLYSPNPFPTNDHQLNQDLSESVADWSSCSTWCWP